MTILKLKNPTNIYRIDVKKTRREQGYLALEDLRIKSKFSRSNMPIREVGWSGETKKPEREEKKEEEGLGRKVGAGVKTQPRRQDLRRQDIWRRATCQVTVTSESSPRPGAELMVQILKSYL